ncbi:hypothetical protein EGW08_007648 [Elysia chlorotica]|uniref:Hexosyltransferase n=1 Tax=Elysia chlorotica TaxID=188477 RepID=A0A433TSV7_ELYCH|nr:hypothetical protein EGW08_007648 [Elysia chlorotica]
MRLRFCLTKALSFCAWFLTFVCLMVVHQALQDLMRSIIGHQKHTPTALPTTELTAFVLDLPGACADVQDYDALLVVHSATDHFRHRSDYRQTYGNPEFTQPYRLKVIFFLGLPALPQVQQDVALEHSYHRDIIQANFVDSYHNLTLKAVAVLRWLVEKCPPPHLIVKIDDDVVLDVHRLFEEFSPMPPYYNDLVIHCHYWEAATVNREGKWRVSRLQYALDSYPDYCSGFLVLLKLPAVEELYYAALDTKVLWVDDAFIYGIVRSNTLDVQIMYLDHVAETEEKYASCVQQHGYSCKYWATNLDKSPQSKLLPSLLSLRADRLRHLRQAQPARSSRGSHWATIIAGRPKLLRRRRQMERMRLGSTGSLSLRRAPGYWARGA